MTYRAVTRNRDVVCDRYVLGDHGVELYDTAETQSVSSARRTPSDDTAEIPSARSRASPDDEEETFLAFVPYENLLMLLNEEVARAPDPSIL